MTTAARTVPSVIQMSCELAAVASRVISIR